MIKSSANFYNTLIRLGRATRRSTLPDDMELMSATKWMQNPVYHLNESQRLKAIAFINRVLQTSKAGKPVDQRAAEVIHPIIQDLFNRGALSARDYRQLYRHSTDEIRDIVNNSILARNKSFRQFIDRRLRATPIRSFSAFPRPLRRKMLRYVQGLSSGDDLADTTRATLDKWMRSYPRYESIIPDPKALPLAQPYHRSQGLVSTAALVQLGKRKRQPIDTKQLHEQFYAKRPTIEESLQRPAPAKLMSTSWRSAIENELEFAIRSPHLITDGRPIPRSVQRALDIVKGQNILEPGTRANRFYNKLIASKSPKIQKFIKESPLSRTFARIPQLQKEDNALYSPTGNFIAVPKKRKWFLEQPNPTTEAHEKGHFFAHNLPDAEHKAIAANLFGRLAKAQHKLNLDIPFDNPSLMQEAFAQGYAADILKKPRSLDEQLDILRDLVPRSMYKPIAKNIKLINASPDIDEATKQMLGQLRINYHYDIFSKWV